MEIALSLGLKLLHKPQGADLWSSGQNDYYAWVLLLWWEDHQFSCKRLQSARIRQVRTFLWPHNTNIGLEPSLCGCGLCWEANFDSRKHYTEYKMSHRHYTKAEIICEIKVVGAWAIARKWLIFHWRHFLNYFSVLQAILTPFKAVIMIHLE